LKSFVENTQHELEKTFSSVQAFQKGTQAQ